MKNKKVLYSVSGLPEWVDVAKTLKDKQNWEPVYWITVPGLEEEVKQVFPDIIHHWFYDINRGIYHSNYCGFTFPLDKELINKFIQYESTALNMLDRYDPYRTFTYKERKRLYYNQLSYWLHVLKTLSVDIVILTESPHSIAQYTCYMVSKHYGIETIMLGPTSIPGLVFIKRNIEDIPQYNIVRKSEHYEELIEKYIQHLTQDYSIAEPWYMREQKYNKKSITQKLRYAINRLGSPASYNTQNRNNYYKLKARQIEDSYMNMLDLIKLKIYAKSTIRKLQRKHAALEQIPSHKQNYIYFPLHFQPERTSCPEGDIYEDQLLIINMISSMLPKGWLLYVKEHPSQFMLGNGYMGRTEQFYDDIATKKNARLINGGLNAFDLIDNAKAVVTLTGTVGIESITRGVPVLVFGYAWYRKCPGTFYITSNEDCRVALSVIEGNYQVNKKAFKAYLLGLEKCFIEAYLNPSSKPSTNISKAKLIENLYTAISSHDYR